MTVDKLDRWLMIWRWLMLAAMVALVLAVLALQQPNRIDPARIRAACEQYAALDLAGFARICADAGYQQTAP